VARCATGRRGGARCRCARPAPPARRVAPAPAPPVPRGRSVGPARHRSRWSAARCRRSWIRRRAARPRAGALWWGRARARGVARRCGQRRRQVPESHLAPVRGQGEARNARDHRPGAGRHALEHERSFYPTQVGGWKVLR
jgi:hypothetical protein